jgi:hypothetical protein
MTRASDTKNSPPDRPGANSSSAQRPPTSDRLPPTLLRLPDLELNHSEPPIADDIAQETHEIPPVTITEPGAVSAALAAATESWNASIAEAEEANKVQPRSKPDSGYEAPETSLLARFASRKVLLALLLLIAGLAIWMPRQQANPDNLLNSQIAESSTTDLETNKSTLLPEHAFEHTTAVHDQLAFGDSPAHDDAQMFDTQTAAITANDSAPAQSRIGQPLVTSPNMIQQPTSPSAKQFDALTSAGNGIEHQTASMAMSQANLPSFQEFRASTAAPTTPQIQRVSTQTPEFDFEKLDSVAESLAAAANEEIRRMDAERAAAAVATRRSTGEFDEAIEFSEATQDPVILESRTPSGTIDWSHYLPPIDAESFGAQSGEQPSVAAGKDTDLRPMTSSPAAPDFRFVLPGGLAPSENSTNQTISTSPAYSQPPASSAPDARVAMPPMDRVYTDTPSSFQIR